MTTASADADVAQDMPAQAPAAAATDTAPYERLGREQLIAHRGCLVSRISALLSAPEPESFVASLTAQDDHLLALIKLDIDRTLVVGMHAAGTTGADYRAAHSPCVALASHQTGRVLGNLDDGPLCHLRLAALTMNIGMALQDQLALQDGPLVPEQQAEFDAHAEAGAARLQALGVNDADWPQAVRQHHDVAASAPTGRSVAELNMRLDLPVLLELTA